VGGGGEGRGGTVVELGRGRLWINGMDRLWNRMRGRESEDLEGKTVE
jgi:hypothetical protein